MIDTDDLLARADKRLSEVRPYQYGHDGWLIRGLAEALRAARDENKQLQVIVTDLADSNPLDWLESMHHKLSTRCHYCRVTNWHKDDCLWARAREMGRAVSDTPTTRECPVKGDHMLRTTQEQCPACTPTTRRGP